MNQPSAENTANQPPTGRACHECGYGPVFTATCPICGSETIGQSPQTFPHELRQNPHSYSLATLFLVMTVICVGLGAIVAAPGLGIPFVVLTVPAFARSAAAKRRAGLVAQSWTMGERVMSFLCSLGLMLLIGTAGVIAFQIACWSSCWGVTVAAGEGYSAFLAGVWIGGAAGIFTIVWLLWRTWPKAGR
jgi:hypothetical protein